MEASIESEQDTIRVLGLGNEILADDAVGILAAREAGRRLSGRAGVVCSRAAGFDLLDDLLGVSRLVVVDAIVTGAKPGTVHLFTADRFRPLPGVAPHLLGIFDVLAVAERLRLPVPRETTVIAVEAADCTTVGGPMHPDVVAAIPVVADWIEQFLSEVLRRQTCPGQTHFGLS